MLVKKKEYIRLSSYLSHKYGVSDNGKSAMKHNNRKRYKQEYRVQEKNMLITWMSKLRVDIRRLHHNNIKDHMKIHVEQMELEVIII